MQTQPANFLWCQWLVYTSFFLSLVIFLLDSFPLAVLWMHGTKLPNKFLLTSPLSLWKSELWNYMVKVIPCCFQLIIMASAMWFCTNCPRKKYNKYYPLKFDCYTLFAASLPPLMTLYLNSGQLDCSTLYITLLPPQNCIWTNRMNYLLVFVMSCCIVWKCGFDLVKATQKSGRIWIL